MPWFLPGGFGGGFIADAGRDFSVMRMISGRICRKTQCFRRWRFQPDAAYGEDYAWRAARRMTVAYATRG